MHLCTRQDSLTYKNHHDPDQVNCQIPLFGIRVQKVEHEGGYDEENKVAHLSGTQSFNHYARKSSEMSLDSRYLG